MHSHRLNTVDQVKTFILAGNATVTLVSKVTGARFTYRVRQPNGNSPHFVQLMNGPDNESSYTFLGTIFRGADYAHGRKSKVNPDALSAKTFAWFWSVISKGHLPSKLEVWHEGKCGRCGRKLTVPESIESGFGPECITFVRVHPQQMEIAA